MNAWVVRIHVNIRNTHARRDLGNVDALHKRMMLLVPNGLGPRARAETGLLFRVEEDDYTPTITVQTLREPDIDRLPAGYGHIEVKDLSPMFDKLTKDRAVHYRITASATKRKPLDPPAAPGSNKRGPVVPLRGRDAERWWSVHAERAGLELRSITSSPGGAARGNGIRHDLTRFDGTAIVRDPHALATAVTTGIGRGKPYGAGLLSLAPARIG
jgi:CRISPR system Cascade subunit CasE